MLEYTYETAEQMAADMQRWGVPPVGSKQCGSSTVVRSAVLPIDFLEVPMSAFGYTPTEKK